MKYQYAFPRKHTATMNGKTITFKSVHFDPYYLWNDALQACRDAGIFQKTGDADKMLIDGRPA